MYAGRLDRLDRAERRLGALDHGVAVVARGPARTADPHGGAVGQKALELVDAGLGRGGFAARQQQRAAAPAVAEKYLSRLLLWQ